MNQNFLNAILEDAFDHAHDPDIGGLRLTSIASALLIRLEEAGIISEPQISYFLYERGNVAAEVHGWAIDLEDDLLRLFLCIDATVDVPLGDEAAEERVSKDAVDRALRRIESFVRHSLAGKFDDIEESQPASELVRVLKNAVKSEQQIELHVLATGIVTDRAATVSDSGDYRREVWDLTRLSRVCGVSADGTITIDFEARFGKALPCLLSPPDADGVQVLLTRIPGQVLAAIYNEHRSSLLERNVRSFLQFTGKVNKGIRDTLKLAPHRFLAYNNGLSTTASSVTLTASQDGTAHIRSLADFQIVNGGQTTASIASAARRGEADLSQVVVPMKLTIVPADKLQGLVPQISRYANTQNRIQDADFFANAPWHVALERLSRATWTAATTDAPRGTRWFYERSRGQYSDELGASATQAGRRKFRSENPGRQKFTKTDLAKYWMSWEQFPHIVSLGAQKCFARFMETVVPRRPDPDEAEFRRMIALALLFKTAETLYGVMGFTGYRAQVVTYTVARLSNHVGKRLPVWDIWKSQAVPESYVVALKPLITGVREVIVNPPAGKNLTEWCKKEDCWNAVSDRRFVIDLAKGDVSAEGEDGAEPVSASVLSPEERALVRTVSSVSTDVWMSASTWAKQTSSLLPWQRSLAYSLGRLAGSNRAPSVKQATQGAKLLTEALRLGFRHDDLGQAAIAELKAVSGL